MRFLGLLGLSMVRIGRVVALKGEFDLKLFLEDLKFYRKRKLLSNIVIIVNIVSKISYDCIFKKNCI
jgi:hypothetical protein